MLVAIKDGAPYIEQHGDRETMFSNVKTLIVADQGRGVKLKKKINSILIFILILSASIKLQSANIPKVMQYVWYFFIILRMGNTVHFL